MYYYQHHIGDFKSATAHLDDHQLATYLRMLWACYDTEKPLSGDIDDIAFAMRTDEKTVRLLLRHFFKETPEGWVNPRCEREIREYHEKSEKARKSANARWNNANALRTHSKRNAIEPVFDANQEPRTKNQEPREEAKAKALVPAKPKPDPAGSEVVEIFEHWKSTMNHPRAVLDSKRLAAIKRALKTHSSADLCLAVTGCSRSEFHMGRNDRQTVYDDLTLIFRDASKIEQFMRMAEQPLVSADPRVIQAQRNILAFADGGGE